MNKNTIFAFLTGAAVGAFVTWKAVKTKYERMAQEQIASMRQVIAKKQEKIEKKPDDIKAEIDNMVETHDATLRECEDVIAKCGYGSNYVTRKDNENFGAELIYVIAPEEYGEKENYDCAELTYWSDGVLTDDLDEPIEDVEGTIRYESLKHFGEYEDDSVFVRNEIRKIDYQILLDTRAYHMAILEVK